MTVPDPIRVSFIGAGGICEQRHLPGLQQIPGVELVAVCNRSAESSERIKQKWGFARIESDYRKVIDDPHVDAIFIGTWPYLHRELSVAALEAGKHVFCQARMCMDWNEAQQMCATAKSHPQQVSMVCPSPFRVRWERTVKQVLSSREFGSLKSVNVISFSNANSNPNQLSWREQREFSGDNILQVGIFAETLNAWCGEYESLAAETFIPQRDKFDSTGRRYEVQIPQQVRIHGQLKSGVSAREFHDGLSSFDASQITLFGEHQSCVVDLLVGKVSFLLNKSADSIESTPIEEMIVDAVGDPWQVEHEFIAAVLAARRGEPWRAENLINPDFQEASRYMLKMQAIHDSAASGQPVELRV
jgi:predicted dehydrogenase